MAELFDWAVVRDGSVTRRMSPEEFLGMPLSERLRHIIGRTVKFYLDGQEVDRQEVLNRLRELRAKL